MRDTLEQTSINAVTDAFKTMNLNTKVDTIQYQRFDMSVTGNTGIGKLEVKYRRLDFDTFKKYWTKSGFILESSKYDAIHNLNSMYINYFNINDLEILIGWNLSGKMNATLNHSTEAKMIYCPSTTDFSNNNNVLKHCYLLKRRTTTLRMIKFDGKWIKLSMNDFNNYINSITND